MSARPIAARAAKFRASIENVLLDGTGEVEDVLSQPWFELTRIVKSIDGLALTNQTDAIVLITSIQARLSVMTDALRTCMPRSSREKTLREITPALVTMLEPIDDLIRDIAKLDPYLSPLGDLYR